MRSRMVTFRMTLTDPNPVFKITEYEVNYPTDRIRSTHNE